MALIRRIKWAVKQRHSVHGETECTSSIFSERGRTYLQLDTYGSKTRKNPEKISQSLQFDQHGARQLKRLIAKAFPDLQ